AGIEKATSGFWQKSVAGGKLVLRETAALSGHAIMGVAMGYVAHRIVTGKEQPPPATLEEWLLQGAGIAVGRYVGKAIEHRAAQQKKLAAIKNFEPGARLLAEAEQIAQLAKQVELHPEAKHAMELLEKRHKLLTDEMAALDQLEKSPEMMKAAGMTKASIASSKAELRTQLNEVHSQGFGDVPLPLAGLEELIPGALWSGTPEQIGAAVHTAKEAGIDIHAKKDPVRATWHLTVEGREIVIEERAAVPDHDGGTHGP